MQGVRRRTLDRLQNSIQALTRWLAGNISPGNWLATATAVGRRVEAGERIWLRWHWRPYRPAHIAVAASRRTDRIGVVIQGPLALAEDFTVESVALYRRLFPNDPVILSTWSDSDPAALERIRALGAEIVLSEAPKLRGLANVNLQAHSSIAGIRRAKELGVSHVLKTRGDQRFHAATALDQLWAMSRVFPLALDIAGRYGQRERIVGVSLDSYKHRLYGVGDMLVFGQIDDMLIYWDCPIDTRTSLPPSNSWYEHARNRIAEVYITTSYFERLGRPIAWTLRDSWEAYRDHFAILDSASIDLFWPKYAREQEHRMREYEHSKVREPMTFRDWFLLHAGAIDLEGTPEERVRMHAHEAVPR